MKRNFLVAIMTVVSVFMAKAQNNELPMATLEHGDQTLVLMLLRRRMPQPVTKAM